MSGLFLIQKAGSWWYLGQPSAVSTFTVGATEPTESNTGAGILRAYPTEVIAQDTTVGDGEVLADKIIRARVTVTGTGRVENCRVEGASTEPTASVSLVNTSNAVASPFGVPNVQFTDIIPQKPSAYWTGIGNKNYSAFRVKLLGCIDAFSAFSTTTDGLCKIKIRACLAKQLTHFAPDYANSNRTRTHNDCLQMQGNLGGPEDILLEGNAFEARHHPTFGTQPTVYSELACLMVSPNTQSRVSFTSRNNWYRGGIFTINAGATNTGGSIILEGDRFEKPGTLTPGPTNSIVIDAATTRTVTAVTYIQDGSAVPVTNG